MNNSNEYPINEAQPIESWTKEDFINHGKFVLESMRTQAPQVNEGDYNAALTAWNSIADGIRALYRDAKRGNFSLEDVGTSEAELREMVASSKGLVRSLTEEEENEIWEDVFKK